MIQRRGFLAGIGALLAAPAIIRTPGLLMPVKIPILSYSAIVAGGYGINTQTINGAGVLRLPQAEVGTVLHIMNNGAGAILIYGQDYKLKPHHRTTLITQPEGWRRVL